MAKGWLDNYGEEENYNDSQTTAPQGFDGDGYSNVGRNYSPAWGGQFQMGGNVYPVNYVPQAQGGMSMPGATGNMYTRIGAPSKGPRRNQTDVTDASAQNGKEMQYYQEGLDWKPKSISRDGGWLNQYDVAQEGEELPSVRSLINDTTNRKNQSKGKEVKTVQKDNAKTITPKLGKQLTPEQIEQRRVQQLIDKQGTIRASTPQSTSSRLKEIALNPLTAFGYAARNENLPENFSRGERNSLDMATDIINPAFYLNQANEAGNNVGSSVSNIAQGNLPAAYRDIKNAGMNTLNALPLVTEYKTIGKGLQQLKNIPTSISPELKEGLHTNGFLDMFKSKKPTNISGQDWLHKWNNDPITLNKIAKREKLSEISSHPRFEEAFPEYPVIREGQLADKELNDIKTEFINNVIGNDRNFPIKTNIKEIPVLSYEDLKMNDPLSYKDFNNTSGGLSPGRGKVYINESAYKNVPPEIKESAKVHELTHSAEGNGINLTPNEEKELLLPFGENSKPIWNGKTYDKSYFTDPSEIHARINQARFELGLSPKDKFTEQMFDDISKKNNWNGMGEYIKDKKGFIDLMNNFWAVPPVVIGAGALQQTNQEETPQMKKGGIVKGDQDGYRNPKNRGKVVEIEGDTMGTDGYNDTLYVVPDVGEPRIVYANTGNHEFPGATKFREYPMAKNGLRQEQKGLQNLDDLINFTNYNKPTKGGWLDTL
jgi:hypothetical protein